MTKERIISTTDRTYFQLCQSILSMNEIPFQISSTVDSMFNDFGTFEIYVTEHVKNRAIDVLNNYEDAPDA
tara:strand:+ start:144 stop:356 length:213 start_codon:yes stop_codon:yes gene_type:complete